MEGKNKKSKKINKLKSFDIIIIGGGISGLYTAYNLIKKHKNKKILLLESNDRLGGRILTINHNDVQYEAGAGRFHNNQYRFMNLLKDLKLDSKLIPITDHTKFIPFPKNKYIDDKYFHKILDNQNIINEILQLIKDNLITEEELINNSFLELIDKKLKFKYPNVKEIFEDTYEYWSEIAIMNSYDALKIITQDFITSNQYYVLHGGLSQVIDKLEKKISKNVKIIKSCMVNKITKEKKKETLYTINEKYSTHKLILALPKHSLLNIDFIKKNKYLSKLLNTIEESPLLRVYAQYPKNIINHHTWFDKYPNKIVTGSKLKYIIPIDYSKGLTMITYTDGKYTKPWINSISNNNLEHKIKVELKKTFPDIDIPEPSWVKPHLWTYGAGYWKKGIKSDDYLDKIIHPNKDEDLYICNENYSKHQTWMEGALQSSNMVIKLIKF